MKTLQHKFFEFIPEAIEEGIIYISIEYHTAVHKCVCGCGNKVITPITPNDWQLTFDGKTISLYPSIGNWSFPCRSHYWIEHNKIKMARQWTKTEIQNNRKSDEKKKIKYFKPKKGKRDD